MKKTEHLNQVGDIEPSEETISSQQVAEKHGLIRFMSMQEVCAYVGCSKRYLEDEIKRKNIKAYKPVRDLKFDPRDVESWIKKKVQSA